MPYDALIWGEEGAASGLTARTAKGPNTYTISGDTITLKGTDRGTPILFGLGATSDTKAGGCAVVPSLSNRAVAIYGPAAIDILTKGWDDFRLSGGVKQLSNGETLTGQIDNANTNEGSVMGCFVSYGGYPAVRGPSAGANDMFREKITITSAAAVTYNSGAVALNTACTSSTWLNTRAKYEIRGISGCVGAATFGGMCSVTNLGGAWAAYTPGFPVPGLSAVTFAPDGVFVLPEPIPFDGDSLPSVGMTATSAGAIVFTMHIAEVG